MSVGTISSSCPVAILLSFSFALLEHRFEFFFERSRRNAEHAKPRQVVRGCGVDLHKLDLIAGEARFQRRRQVHPTRQTASASAPAANLRYGQWSQQLLV